LKKDGYLGVTCLQKKKNNKIVGLIHYLKDGTWVFVTLGFKIIKRYCFWDFMVNLEWAHWRVTNELQQLKEMFSD
jgi:hypothetical protein